ncbi:hypothetical protein BCR35DRAFT_331167 [Leucosporidium creatinivorum]|uniref:60Kd inner membrane protein-domain-containing protein n=1 Tax=Leucosporidium creatinivorum TaxID=106004 RepID=A0A1Y2FIT7_9BASI|nr:hypothetical protein BCR35DRAFT_331167 [Leucosporidium creatinivorum]
MLPRSSLASSAFRRPVVLPLPLLRPPTLVPQARSFSLWPSAPTPEASSSASPTLTPPSLTELTAPLHLPSPTFFDSASTILLSLPPSLGLSYVAFIPLVTLLIRGGSTLPLTLWQRKRTRRYQEKVLPEIRKRQEILALEVRDSCRRAGKSFEEYKKEYAKRAKKEASIIARRYSASPMPTLLLPPLLHIPVFIATTLILRDACQRALAALPLTSTSLTTLPPSPDGASTLTPEVLGHLHDLAATAFQWCPSLVLPDPTMALPLAVGLAALANVEVSAKTRRANAAAALAERGDGVGQGVDRAARVGMRVGAVGAKAGERERAFSGSLTAAEKGRIRARRSRDQAGPPSSRGYATPSLSTAAPAPASPSAPAPAPTKEELELQAHYEREQQLEPRAARIMTNALRFSAVLFIPVAAMAPSAVCLYWLTSNLFTLVQSSVFAYIDRKREKARRLEQLIRSG